MLAILQKVLRKAALLVGISLSALQEPCRFERVNGREQITLLNSGEISGWVVVSNKTQNPVLVVNALHENLARMIARVAPTDAQNPRSMTPSPYEYLLPPYGRRSFNWRGQKAILCFRGVRINNETTRFEPIDCSAAVDIVKCFPLFQPTQGERYKDLQLEE
jgi:hypothetical protein